MHRGARQPCAGLPRCKGGSPAARVALVSPAVLGSAWRGKDSPARSVRGPRRMSHIPAVACSPISLTFTGATTPHRPQQSKCQHPKASQPAAAGSKPQSLCATADLPHTSPLPLPRGLQGVHTPSQLSNPKQAAPHKPTLCFPRGRCTGQGSGCCWRGHPWLASPFWGLEHKPSGEGACGGCKSPQWLQKEQRAKGSASSEGSKGSSTGESAERPAAPRQHCRVAALPSPKESSFPGTAHISQATRIGFV